MGSSFSPQSELTPLLLRLAQGCPVATRCSGHCIMCVAQDIKGHADLASSPPSSPERGQSRLTLVTGNKGCVRYPTEGNNSSHELTTAMHHLPHRPCGPPMFPLEFVGVSSPGKVLRLSSH